MFFPTEHSWFCTRLSTGDATLNPTIISVGFSHDIWRQFWVFFGLTYLTWPSVTEPLQDGQ